MLRSSNQQLKGPARLALHRIPGQRPGLGLGAAAAGPLTACARLNRRQAIVGHKAIGS
jgi:hypothetical protein